MPDITKVITVNNDDCSIDGTFGSFNYYLLYVGRVSEPENSAFRFRLGVNQGASIASANLKLNVTFNAGGGGSGVVHGIAEDNCGPFGTFGGGFAVRNPVTLDHTSASVSFPTPGGTGVVTLDVTAIVQEIVNRAGWTAGSYVGLVIIPGSLSGGVYTALEDSSDAGLHPPTLEVSVTGGLPTATACIWNYRNADKAGYPQGLNGVQSDVIELIPNGNADGITGTLSCPQAGTFLDGTPTFSGSDPLPIRWTPANTTPANVISFSSSLTDPADLVYTIKPTQLFGPAAVWNQPCDEAPLHASNADWIKAGSDFGDADYPIYAVPRDPFNEGAFEQGMPINYVHGNSIDPATLGFHPNPEEAYPGESDDPSGGIPIPDNVVIQGDPAPYPDYPGNPFDRHCMVVDLDNRIVHEFWRMRRNGPQSYLCGSYARLSLDSYNLRANNLTSADAAGMFIAPLLLDYDVLQWATDNNTTIPHALRFTLKFTHAPHIWPARHSANSGATTCPPMGLRVRLKADFDISSFSARNQTILRTWKEKGMYQADNGTRWELCFTFDDRWDSVDFQELHAGVHGLDFEAVDDTNRQVGADSMEVFTNIPTVRRRFGRRF